MERLLLIDAYSFAFRAYYALPSVLNKNNQEIGCLLGFLKMIMRVLDFHMPSHAIMVFDSKGKSFRSDIYIDYKAHRKSTPLDLASQLPCLRNASAALSLKCDEQTGYEADDLIATYARQASQMNCDVTIVSVDKDLMQLIAPKITMFDPMQWNFVKSEDVKKKFGVMPSQMRDLQAIIGDVSDNIPGIKGIGIKTGSALISAYNNLENIFNKINEISVSARIKKLLIDGMDIAYLSRELVTLRQDVNIEYKPDNARFIYPNALKVKEFVQSIQLSCINTLIS
jgi:DNA polymerase-1